jgi:isochorismate synthase
VLDRQRTTALRASAKDRHEHALVVDRVVEAAVCGVPLAAARAAIADIEPVDRGYYGGLVGWTDLAGDGEWVVTIRSAEVCDSTVRAFAGAGIVAGSQPAAELAETSAKFRTLLAAIGMEDLG